MALTNDDELAAGLALLRSHGITREAARFQQPAQGGWYYEQQALGFNYRMTDMQAALGISQIERLDAYVARRNHLARRYDAALSRLPLQLPKVLPGNLSAFHLYVVRLPEADARRHLAVYEGLRERGIGVNLHYLPVHLQPYYRGLGFEPGQFPEAERHGATAVTLPLYPAMSEAQQDEVVQALDEVLAK